MDFEVYLVQVETQDQQPDPLGAHSTLQGAIEGARAAGADIEESDLNMAQSDWYFGVVEGRGKRYTVIAIHKLRLLP